MLTSTGEPGEILDAWAGAPLTVIVDAAVGDGATPGRIRRWTPDDEPAAAVVSSHALGRIPTKLVVLTVDVAEIGYGPTRTPQVSGAVPKVVATVLSEVIR